MSDGDPETAVAEGADHAADATSTDSRERLADRVFGESAPRPGRLEALLSGVRFGKFASVGVLGAVCDTAVLFVLLELLGVFPEVAVFAGIETAILVMFAVNDRWTFAGERDRELRSVLRRLGRSHLVRAAGSATQFVVFVAVFRGVDATLVLAGGDRWWLVAKVVGVAVGMLVNYVFESLFTWRVHE
ncbi:MAG: GtrA family protein [Halobacteriaceae archaeon]